MFASQSRQIRAFAQKTLDPNQCNRIFLKLCIKLLLCKFFAHTDTSLNESHCLSLKCPVLLDHYIAKIRCFRNCRSVLIQSLMLCTALSCFFCAVRRMTRTIPARSGRNEKPEDALILRLGENRLKQSIRVLLRSLPG